MQSSASSLHVGRQGLGVMLSDELPPDQFISLVELAESLGYGELWLTDQRFWRDCYMGLTLAARHSERLLLGPGVSDPFTRHPATIAMAIATLDELSHGRAQLGLGVGGSGIREMRLPKERPVRALREAIELARAMLTGETVHFSGELFHLDDGNLGFSPASREIPIFVATHSPQVLRLCGRLADGVLLGNVANRDGLAEAIQFVRDAEQAAGREPGSVVIDLRLESCISDDAEAAIAAMKRRFAVRLIATFPHWDYVRRLRIDASPGLRDAAAGRNLEAVVANLSDEAVMATALVGSAEQVTSQLGALLSADVGRLTIRPFGCAGQDLDATVVSLAERVWPAVSGQTVGST